MQNLIKKEWPKALDGYKEKLIEFDFNPKRGVYFLFENNELIYIGISIDIHTRLISHRNRFSFDRVCYLQIDGDIEPIEKQLIQHFRPKLNITDNPDNEIQYIKEDVEDTQLIEKQVVKGKPQKQEPKYKFTDLPTILSEAHEDVLHKVLDTIPNIEKDIIIKRHGLFGSQPFTLQQVGDEYNLTRERIRQLQKWCRA